jgi:hypothetical protein
MAQLMDWPVGLQAKIPTDSVFVVFLALCCLVGQEFLIYGYRMHSVAKNVQSNVNGESKSGR